MKTALLCVAFYGLGVFNCAVFAAIRYLHRPRYVAPTMHNRKWRDRPVPEVPASPSKDDGVNYSFMGATGLEE
ncbi:hypothetical protein LMG22037_06603 [Paraburkholderia phenoliruptrix]|uniref:Uncharacterized protein n=1 Tax=Paraburkholderia phenoliruptrix TaxID=252970 RepID=A0A6J5CS35_9BURK|nr:hypothetical protein [Paraburkholderia phenoliruptrix]CAB3742449.1 hypothetical protein LMG22037_06603 [Paraburkholderia phenoliruptrix]